ncbi:hypothetical protein [Streptomyces mirabilis]|uniref:hypothetical protein n=1 Tax=Streptomyces mirabilis TaxID=68239 RepID=UPI00225389C1|nr:hypothetical protein [Streptomyces mirabilis]MCX4612118.1 hypothetical protein [Streptomyces mirabilis]
MIDSTQAAQLRQQLAEQRNAQIQQQRDEIRQQLTEIMESDDVQVLAVRAQAIAKQREGSALFDDADRLEHTLALQSKVDKLTAALAESKTEVDRLIQAVDSAAEAEDVALKRVAKANVSAAQAEADEKLGRDAGVEPEVAIDLLMRLNAAQTVAARERSAAQKVTEARTQAQSQLTTAREVVTQARAVLAETQRQLDAADADAPVSAYTLALDWQSRLVSKQPLTDTDRDVIRAFVRDFARMLDLDREFAREALDKHEKEVEARASSMLLPKPGHPLRPSTPA